VGGAAPLISSAVRWDNLLFLAGRAAVDPETNELVSELFEEQARSVLDDVVKALAEAGSGVEHVLRVLCYLTDPSDFPTWNRVWAEYFPAPAPVRTTVVTELIRPGMLIEVEVTAGIPD
jgi:2-iminobutanoate/2-iminopropanoate deaminase